MQAGTKKNVVVTGDLTIDWNLALIPAAEGEGPGVTWWKDTFARFSQQRGGAFLLAELVARVAEDLRKGGEDEWNLFSVQPPREEVFPDDRNFHHSHALWSRSNDKEQAWRVKEFLGLARSTSEDTEKWRLVADDPPGADLIILDDADLGFRQQPELWPRALMDESCSSWILVKMSRPVAQGALWQHLHENCADRVIVVMNINDLRRTEVQISRELSWERTAHDLYWELTHNLRVNALSRCAHVIVSFDNTGAFLLSGAADGKLKNAGAIESFDGRLFFDPLIVEGMWNQAYPGSMIGNTSCLTAGVARQLMVNGEDPDLAKGIQTGLAAMRRLHKKGYSGYEQTGERTGLSFPVEAIAGELAVEEEPFKVAPVPSPVRFLSGQAGEKKEEEHRGEWTILQDRYRESLDQVARNIVLEGVEKALDGVPLGNFGKLVTADRREVESFRSIRSLIGEYCGQSQNRPLSIAVFGPPGSGKSFAVKQVAESVRPGEIVPLEFNLSQLGSVEELHDAFHQVRDKVLSGKMPLVFWDEFDSAFENQPLGWLRHFLAPMQDGAFREGQVVHPVGRCIFVFAGGTCCRMEDFTSALSNRDFIQMKGPDFVSRLKGYVNIFGPNPYTTEEGYTDPYYLIRRAIIFRGILQMNVPHIFSKVGEVARLNIDPGVLRALLHVSEYKHGVRSIESIVSMSSLVGKSAFERSSLPPETQLKLHLNSREFLSLVQQLEIEGELLEDLAEIVHELFCEARKRDGWKWGPTRDDRKKLHPLLKPYAELDETSKETNRVNVRTIPAKLAAAGYIMVPAKSDQTPFDFPGDDLELLARLEHESYVKGKLEQGFTYGEPTDENPRRNPYLVEWEKVPEEIKETDRDLIRGIPKILARAGYAVVKLGED